MHVIEKNYTYWKQFRYGGADKGEWWRDKFKYGIFDTF
jgi:hypothetical protein